jgi:hypothetical protein
LFEAGYLSLRTGQRLFRTVVRAMHNIGRTGI